MQLYYLKTFDLHQLDTLCLPDSLQVLHVFKDRIICNKDNKTKEQLPPLLQRIREWQTKEKDKQNKQQLKHTKLR